MTDRLKGDAEGTRLRRRRRARRWTTRRRTRFLEALAESCNISAAAREAGMDRSSAYDLKDRDPAFARGWKTALERAHADLEWHLLEVSRKGVIRTELVIDPATQEKKHLKLIHSYPLTVAFRLFLSHQVEVERFRAAGGTVQKSGDAEARVLARIAEVRARLLGETGAGSAADSPAAGDGAGDDGAQNDGG